MRNIRNIIIFAVIFITILSAGTVSLIYFAKKGGSVAVEKEQEASLIEPQLLEEEGSQLNTEPQEEPPQSMTLDTDYFTVALPLGWEKTSEGDTVPLVISDTLEKVINQKAIEINFRTNFSVNSTTLGETSLKEYVGMVKNSLIQTISIIEITKEEQVEINGREAYVLEIESTQQDLNFNTVVAILAGKDKTVWAFSFNTLKESWPDYKDDFKKIIDSIAMKQNEKE